MPPFLSIATLPIHRYTPPLGAYVPCWDTENTPFVRRISYQRTPAIPGLASTDWLVTSASCVPKLRYASRKVGRCRYDRMSTVLPVLGCGMQLRLVGLHGKMASDDSTWSWATRENEPVG